MKRNAYVLDPVIQLVKSSTGAIPEGKIAEAAWGKHAAERLKNDPNALSNLMNRVNAALEKEGLISGSTGHRRTRKIGEP
jgi:hypothetical protein